MTEGVWELLQARQLPTAPVRLPRDPSGHAAAERRLETALRALQVAQARGVPDVAELLAAVDAAQQLLDAQPVIEFTARCIPPDDYERLVARHPPTDAQRKQGWTFNTATFRPALLEVALEPSLSEHQWHTVAETGAVGMGELDMLFATVVNLNNRQPQVSTGKG